MSQLVVIGLIFVAVAVMGVVGYQQERKRRAAIARWAGGRGWTYAERDDRWSDHWPDHPFDTGYGQRADNVMTGPFGPYAVVVFDFSYKQSSGSGKTRSTRTYRFAVHALALPVALPWVHLSAEGFLDRAAKFFGAQDIEFESDEFNRAYRVRADDERFAYDLVNPQTMAHLLAWGGPDVRVVGPYLVHVARGRLDLGAVDRWLTMLAGVCDNVPDFVWSDRRVSPPPPLAPGAPR